MNTEKTTDFAEEQLVAYLLGIGETTINEQIRNALETDEALQVQIGILMAMIPSAADASRWRASRSESHEDTHAIEVDSDETQAAGESPQADPDATHSEHGDDQLIEQLDRQGLTPAEISERTGLTRTLVELKLRRIRKMRKRDGR